MNLLLNKTDKPVVPGRYARLVKGDRVSSEIFVSEEDLALDPFPYSAPSDWFGPMPEHVTYRVTEEISCWCSCQDKPINVEVISGVTDISRAGFTPNIVKTDSPSQTCIEPEVGPMEGWCIIQDFSTYAGSRCDYMKIQAVKVGTAKHVEFIQRNPTQQFKNSVARSTHIRDFEKHIQFGLLAPDGSFIADEHVYARGE